MLVATEGTGREGRFSSRISPSMPKSFDFTHLRTLGSVEKVKHFLFNVLRTPEGKTPGWHREAFLLSIGCTETPPSKKFPAATSTAGNSDSLAMDLQQTLSSGGSRRSRLRHQQHSRTAVQPNVLARRRNHRSLRGIRGVAVQAQSIQAEYASAR